MAPTESKVKGKAARWKIFNLTDLNRLLTSFKMIVKSLPEAKDEDCS